MPNRITTYHVLMLLFSLATVIGCKDKLVEDYEEDFELRIISGENQTGVFNEVLPEPIVVEVTHPDGTKPNGYIVLAVPEVGKFIDPFKITENGRAEFEWELGCGPIQEARFKLYGTECDSFTINTGQCPEYGSKKIRAFASQDFGSDWVKGCGIDGGNIFDAKFVETYYGQIILLDNVVYESTDDGRSWEPLTSQSFPTDPTIDLNIVDIEVSPNNNTFVHAILNNNRKITKSESGPFWSSMSNVGDADENDEIGGFIVNQNNIFASFGSDGIFQFEDEKWNAVSNTLGTGNQIFEFTSTGNKVYAVLEKDGEKKLMYNANPSFDIWTEVDLPQNFFEDPYGDFMALPNGKLAIASGITSRLTEFDPMDFTDVISNEYLPNNNTINNFGRSIKNLNFYNGEIYFLAVKKNFIGINGSIYKGIDGDFEKLTFDGLCSNILFFDIRNDGSFIIGCDNGFYVIAN